VLTSPNEAGAVTLALPQDVQTGGLITRPSCSTRASGACRATGPIGQRWSRPPHEGSRARRDH